MLRRALDGTKVRAVIDLRHLEPVDDDVEDLLRNVGQTRLNVDACVAFSREAISMARELEVDIRAGTGLHERACQFVHRDADILDVAFCETRAVGDSCGGHPCDAEVHRKRC